VEPGGAINANAGWDGWDLARVCAAGLIGVVLVVVGAADALGGSDDSPARPAGSAGEAVTLTEYDLLSRAGRLEPAPYWVGRRSGVDDFELERDEDGNLYVRYLAGDDAGTAEGGGADSLTVASYPVGEAEARLETAARANGEELSRRDGFVMLAAAGSNSAYVVFDEQPELQIEIYSPRPGEAARLAGSGALTPLHWTPLG
jgi:hypothetical protein